MTCVCFLHAVAKMWAAPPVSCTGSVSVERAVPSAALRSVAERAATLTAVRKAVTAPHTPTSTVERVHRWVLSNFRLGS